MLGVHGDQLIELNHLTGDTLLFQKLRRLQHLSHQIAVTRQCELIALPELSLIHI